MTRGITFIIEVHCDRFLAALEEARSAMTILDMRINLTRIREAAEQLLEYSSAGGDVEHAFNLWMDPDCTRITAAALEGIVACIKAEPGVNE